ncbi:YdcF family protein [Roseomonas genomospecies 6]|uniref:YdcF family protein n=1 Tax=Roseomonas genomospecies 6 TaxID=214106 RepID=UPI002571319F|nr:YdcF family protein [Roseomonas genomospecies 6]
MLSKLLWLLVSPGNFLVLTLAAGTLLLFIRRLAHWGRRLVAVAAVGFVIVMVTPIASLVALPLEERFPRPDLPERVDGIIMLGGAVNPPIARDRGEPSVNDAAERILGFAELIRRYPQAKAVFTGGSGRLMAQDAMDLREDVAIRGALRQTGIDPDGVIFENESRNTWENALFSQRIVQPKPGETWILVTSAMHMPRSVGIFRQVGWEVIAYPVDYRTRFGGRPFFRFEFDKQIDALQDPVREWIGLVAYRLMGRTDSLFPGPGPDRSAAQPAS